MVERKAFLANPKHQYRLSQYGEHDYGAHKKWRLLWVSKFDPFHRWTLIIRKMVEIKAFHENAKHQYHASQWGEHDCSAHNEKNGDYNEYPSLSHFTDEH